MSNKNWRSEAACSGKETNWFYPETGVKGYAKQIQDVKAFCKLCKVNYDCLQHAISNDEVFGIWGGLTRKERLNFANNEPITSKKLFIKASKKNDNKV